MGKPPFSSSSSLSSKVSKGKKPPLSSVVTKNRTESVSCLDCLPPSPKTSEKNAQKRILNMVKPSIISKGSKQGTSSSLTYKPSDYAQNFDDGRTDKEDDPHNPTFASKYAVPSTK
ncbi:hypothetical protein ACOSQ2_027975 [Xanthoceras sorbifolium]